MFIEQCASETSRFRRTVQEKTVLLCRDLCQKAILAEVQRNPLRIEPVRSKKAFAGVYLRNRMPSAIFSQRKSPCRTRSYPGSYRKKDNVSICFETSFPCPALLCPLPTPFRRRSGYKKRKPQVPSLYTSPVDQVATASFGKFFTEFCKCPFHSQKSVHNQRIKLCSTTFFNDAPGFLMTEGFLVNPL